MKTLRTPFPVTLVLLACLVAAGVAGQSGSSGLEDIPDISTPTGDLRKEVADRLHLTSAQQARLQAVQGEYLTRSREILDLLREKQAEMKKELEAPVLEKSRVQETHRDMKVLTGTLLDLHLEKLVKTREILTPEQHRVLMEITPQESPASSPASH